MCPQRRHKLVIHVTYARKRFARPWLEVTDALVLVLQPASVHPPGSTNRNSSVDNTDTSHRDVKPWKGPRGDGWSWPSRGGTWCSPKPAPNCGAKRPLRYVHQLWCRGPRAPRVGIREVVPLGMDRSWPSGGGTWGTPPLVRQRVVENAALWTSTLLLVP